MLVQDEDVAGARSAVGALVPALVQLVTLAEEEHVTRAAAVLGVTQPTLSRSLARWGQHLGVPLTAPDGRGIRLTPAGRQVAAAARQALDTLTDAVRTVREDADLERGRLTFAFLHTMGPDVVPRLLEAVARQHPGLRVQLRQDAHAAMVAALRTGAVDLVLTAPAPRADDGLAVAVLDTQELVVALPTGHRLAGRAALGLSELGADAWVVLDPAYGMRTITDELWSRAGISPPVAFTGQEASTLRGLVAAGLGVAVLPRAADRPGVAQLRLVPPAHREIVLVARAGPRGAAVEAFRTVALRFAGALVEPPGGHVATPRGRPGQAGPTGGSG